MPTFSSQGIPIIGLKSFLNMYVVVVCRGRTYTVLLSMPLRSTGELVCVYMCACAHMYVGISMCACVRSNAIAIAHFCMQMDEDGTSTSEFCLFQA